MSEITVRQCDECGALHGAVNNWWAVIGDPKSPQFLTAEAAELHTAQAKSERRTLFRLDHCSHKCIGTAFHRWLDTGNVMKAAHEVGDV
jgi:hypothetical protein